MSKDTSDRSVKVDLNKKGLQRLRDITGPGSAKTIENFHAIAPDFGKYIVEFAYGELYARPGLSDKYKELIAVSSLLSQGKTGHLLGIHINGMLNTGWTKDEILEVITFLILYVGFPATSEAMLTAQEVFATRIDS